MPISHETIMEVEDTLQENGVFFNGLRGPGNSSHMDSYMTCIDYIKLEETWEKIKNSYSDLDWIEIIKYWEYHAYHSPNASQLASFIKRKFYGLKILIK